MKKYNDHLKTINLITEHLALLKNLVLSSKKKLEKNGRQIVMEQFSPYLLYI